jgi:diadenosine tetraphosphate (Ap4A) HIT family hydrolase
MLMNTTPGHCVFCKIISGDVHDSRVFEDEVSLAFLDHRQAAG